MIGVALLWAFVGMSPAMSLSTAPSLVNVTIHQTALLPFSFQPPSPSWKFISIKWEFISTNGSVPILVYLLVNCRGNGTSLQWWERECNIDKEVDEEYFQRADILKNGTLMIHHAGVKDAGMYQATIRTFGVKVSRTVNLTVTRPRVTSTSTPGVELFTLERVITENMMRMIVSCFILCFLWLLVVEHVHMLEDGNTPQGKKAVSQRGRSTLDWS
ncbi:uncharacterized protein LOC134396885 [Elgaria multicarinata webbii]|uniref:uncharacterized protein LOC134396885 n=1 Tax=Elgaria multicarinata webbii TaxID=159646 RepID=UPI002FCD5A78